MINANEENNKPVAKLSTANKISLDFEPYHMAEIRIGSDIAVRVFGKTKKLCTSRAKAVHEALIRHQLEK